MYQNENDGIIFCLFILCGILSGVLFDFFKILRRSFGKKDGFTNFCDALFWTFFTAFFLWANFSLNDGKIRWFLFFSIFLGLFIYFLLFSKIFVFLGVFILGVLKKTVKFLLKILLSPLLFIAKKMKKAAVFVFTPIINLKKKGDKVKRFIKRKARILKICKKKI